MVVSELESMSSEPEGPESRALYLILFPAGLQERIIEVLDRIGVCGYSEGPNLIGRGTRGRHSNKHIWPGATGEIFTAIAPSEGEVLMQRLRTLNDELQRTSHGLHGLHVLNWPCQRLL